jgi:hypothetical protein
MGQAKEAIAEMERSRELDPLSAVLEHGYQGLRCVGHRCFVLAMNLSSSQTDGNQHNVTLLPISVIRRAITPGFSAKREW